MDKSVVKAWLDEHARKIIDLFGLRHWHVNIEIGRCPSPGAGGECRAKMEYERATIWIDHEEIDDVEELERVFKHEVAHILHSPMTMLWAAMAEFVPTDSNEERSMKAIWSFAIELTVKNIERMHYAHVDMEKNHER